MTNTNYKRIACAQCNTEFSTTHKRKYCTERCRSTAQDRKAGVIPRAEYEAARRAGANWFKCEHCGKDSYRKMSGTNTGPNRFCSMACRTAKALTTRIAVEAARQAHRLNVQPEIDALRRIAKYIEKSLIFRFNCVHCDSLMIVKRNGGLHKKVCSACTIAAIKTAKAIGKAKRRATERGLEAQNINPIAVFERDKWKCKLCGVSTPKTLRGTYEPRAPELDHILPISKGGAHTWGNVQCTCRACNGLKSNKPLGQFSFDMS